MGTPAQVIEQAAISGYDEGHARKQQRKDMLTDEQHALKRDDLIKSKDALTAQLATYKDAKGNLIPEMKDQHDKTMAALAQNQYDFGQLYDPIKAPGKLQQDWHYLRERIHGIKHPDTPAPATPQSPTTTPDTPAAPGMSPESPVYQQTMGSGPSAAADLPPVTPENGGMQTPNTPGFGPPSAASKNSDSVMSAKADSVAPPVIPKAPIAWKDRGQYQSPGELKKIAAARQKAQQEASFLESTSGLSPEQQASIDARAAAAKQEAEINATVDIAKKLGIDITPEELKQKMGFKSFALKPIPGAAGQAVLQPDGSYARPMSTSDNTTVWQPMPPGWKPNTKAIVGTVINTKQHGWIKTWLDPFNTNKVVGWQPTTPPRGDLGTQSSSESVDAMGLKTHSARKNMPVGIEPKDFDFGSIQQLPPDFDGTVSTPPPPPPASAAPSSPVPSGGTPSPTAPSSAPPSTVAKPVTGGASPKTTPKATTIKTPSQLKAAIPAPPTETSSGTPAPPVAAGRSPGNAYFDSLVNNVMSGKTPPSEIPGGPKVKSMVEARISQLDPSYDPTKADSDYKYANEKSTKDLLNYLTSLTGKNGKGGNLADLVSKSDRIDRTDFPPINDKIGWAKINSGSREMAEYYTTITEVADQVAKILQGGGSGGGTSDAKLRQASELFDKGFTKDQIRGVADSLTSLLGNRKDAIIGDNYYLNRWYKPKPEHYLYAKDPNGNIKRKQADDQSPLPPGWTMMPQGWMPNAPTAAK